MKKEVTVWKVLFIGDKLNKNKRVSTRGNESDDPFILSYPVNEWVKPKLNTSKLFCFKSEIHARQFMDEMGGEEYFKLCKAIAKNPVSIDHIAACWHVYFGRFWSKQLIKSYWNTVEPPKGTLVCDELRCLE